MKRSTNLYQILTKLYCNDKERYIHYTQYVSGFMSLQIHTKWTRFIERSISKFYVPYKLQEERRESWLYDKEQWCLFKRNTLLGSLQQADHLQLLCPETFPQNKLLNTTFYYLSDHMTRCEHKDKYLADVRDVVFPRPSN